MSPDRPLPRPLAQGDWIGVVTLSAPEPALNPEPFARGLDTLQNLGFHTQVADHAAGRHGYRVGTEAELLHDFHALVADPGIDAIVVAGGGKSANRLLRGLDFTLLAAHPKPIVGVSDPTVLLNAITARTGMPTFHGPSVVWDFGAADCPQATLDHFVAALTGDPAALRIDAPLDFARPGTAQGHLVAGCLSSLRCLLGTPYEPDWNGAVLVWEDAFKSVDVLDQALTHFRDCGALERIAGMVVGDLVGCETAGGWDAREMVMDVCAEYAFPIAFGLPFGHTPLKHTLPIGADVVLDPAAEHALTLSPIWQPAESLPGGTR
ncbi:LD-carboxypeptidase [Streptomyces sp. NPDC046275]|uniref:S66 peptidase family protein n=1 Tax=Streptomyces sp. NPDC046275 TaxID=3157201 RepID=UPI0033C37542